MIQDISIQVMHSQAILKWEVTHLDDGQIIVKEKKKDNWKDPWTAQGKITIGSYEQLFLMSLNLWSLDDYKRQWKESLDRILHYDTSCVVTDINIVRGMHSMAWWNLYRVDNVVYIQHHYLLGSMYTDLVGENIFSPETCYNFIPKRRRYEDDGEMISELIIEL